ncbi:MAG TPA: N-6 DNA methylase [Caldisericia bacterium]|nr:N-6 DNA methylase [Caldisericia bacterium]
MRQKEIFSLLDKYDVDTLENSLIYLFIEKNSKHNGIKNNLIKDRFKKINPQATDYVIDFLKRAEIELNLKNLETIFEMLIEPENRKTNGAFYTPDEIVEHINNKLITKNENVKVCDPSCGSGAFLVLATQKISSENKQPIIKTIEDNIYGADIDQRSINRTKIILSLLALQNGEDKEDIKFNLKCGNSIDKKNFSWKEIYPEVFKDGGFDFIIGNPPYIEMKIMNDETKKVCKRDYGDICKGSFDIFICFIKLGMDILKEGGSLGYIIPNKFMATKYASTLRKIILNQYTLKEIINVSSIEVFKDISVYPIILVIEKTKTDENRVLLNPSVESINQLNGGMESIYLNQNLYNLTDDKVFFFLPKDKDERNVIVKMINSGDNKLSDFLTTKWSVSFHKSGLREQFISESPKGNNPQKIIGGKSFGGNTEVQRYKLNWNNYWIDYDEAKAKEIKNQFPPKKIFEQDKIIICQNSKRIRATLDKESYYCKDIFFVSYLTDKAKELNVDIKYLLAILNSELMSYFYSIIFNATHIGGDYLHYLPIYLNSLPIRKICKEKQEEIIVLVDKLLAEKREEDFKTIDSQIDDLIYSIYEITPEEKYKISNIVKETL